MLDKCLGSISWVAILFMRGDHNTSEVGRFMIDVKTKRPCDRKRLWVGTGAIILKGVTISRDSIIGTGSVVTHSIREYSIADGIPARVIKPRFSDEQLKAHKLMLDQQD